MLRKIISRLPTGAKKLSADILALLVYWPLASISRVLKAVLNNDFYKKSRSAITMTSGSI